MSHSLLTFVALSALLLGAHSFNPTTTKSYTRGPSTLAHPYVVGYLPRGTRARLTARPVSMMAFWDFLTNKGNEPAAPGSSFEGGISTLPRSYDEIHRQATDCIRSALSQGYRAVEVEFPPIAQVNKQSDGSASSQAIVRRANVQFFGKVANSLAGNFPRVFFLCGDRATLQELGQSPLPPNIQLGLLSDGASVARTDDLVLVATPAETRQWATALQLAGRAPVVVLQGVFNNGFRGFEMAYYLKPMTFNSRVVGYLTRQLPGPWAVLSAADGTQLPIEVSFVQTPEGVRPDLQSISRALSM